MKRKINRNKLNQPLSFQEKESLNLEQKIKQELSPWKEHKAIRYTTYAALTIGILWGSKYLFNAISDNVTAFKKLIKAVKS